MPAKHSALAARAANAIGISFCLRAGGIIAWNGNKVKNMKENNEE